MKMAPEIDVRDLNSVRRAAKAEEAGVVLGDDWVAPDAVADREAQEKVRGRSFLRLNRSPLARKIITFNLLALIILVSGVLYLNPSRDNLAFQRASGLVSEAELIADIFETQIALAPAVGLAEGEARATLSGLDLRGGVDVYLFRPDGTLVASTKGLEANIQPVSGLAIDNTNTLITDLLNSVWEAISRVAGPAQDEGPELNTEDNARSLVAATVPGTTQVDTGRGTSGSTIFSVATPVFDGSQVTAVVAVTSAEGEIDGLVRAEREQLLQMFVIGILVSIGLSLVLASTIANPLAELAAAAEIGRDRNARSMSPTKVRIPDLTGRPDEIGRLSGALRGMVAALYERIEGNEQFAADVAHEIKNPLASLRSAVGTMRVAKRDDQRERLLDVIDHDVRRLDRLVSDISNASRLDSELVKEKEQSFDLLKMLGNINEHLGKQAAEREIDFISDLPKNPIVIQGLEGRLAQVFVNLISNAISFCGDGDAIRVWARRRDNRILVVVEDTGPGIPENALTKIFKRFYSERPPGQFGNNSGLGLAISKQIVEAHGGVIWAENIRPTDTDPTSEPLGARFVVGLPV